MKLAQYHDGTAWRVGAVEGEEIADLASGCAELPGSVTALVVAGGEALDAARRAVRTARRLPLASVRLGPPVTPRKFLGLGLCYASHAREMERRGMAIPEHQVWFNKQVTALNGPYDPIHMPRVSSQLDYEAELALVISRRGRHVKAADAMSMVAGVMICNDVSVRDWQRRSPTATLGKSFDTHGPVGPWLTTIDDMRDLGNLSIRSWVDGELRQDGNTSEMIWSFGQMIEELSSVFTLEPGDILSTGTPAGVGQGFDPPRFLTEGQTVRVEIEGLGHIENRVVAEP
jgi:2-keto-4-pentenoate hydratase/2-oxohepta-3-ene-1,7-dioic acid hydratase in catechol pathway